MAVEEVGEKYRCNICGNEVTVTKAGGGTLVCCGEDMEKLKQDQNNTKLQCSFGTNDCPKLGIL